MLRTRLTELLGIEHPIVSAPMVRMSGGNLAGAVSAAGALGTFGAAAVPAQITPDYVHEQVAAIRGQTDRPFGIGFLTHHLPDSEPNFVAALDEQVPVMLFSFADPTPWVRRAKETGVLTICQVQSMEDAALAATAGADVLAVQGNEAGGHTGRANLLPFLVQAIEAFPAIPVIAAGGITSGRALAAVLAAGAEGAWMGTLFTAVVEADELSPLHKEAVVASDGRDTVYSAAYDIVSDRAFGGPPWPARIATRAKLNPFLQQWLGREAALTEHADELVGDMRRAYRSADPALMPLLYGEGAGAITTVRTSREVVTEICADAGRLLQDRSSIVD